ncbi:MAG: hypothetical protein A3H59_01975 [Candidatus Jacksonbacteria bacterium RIFCSPLOWO2_02_FULL_43_9]|nr:MAG: hypothetical protein A2986_03535 [Candidatus Jacksonbacteria bacterium RIFCSPLOWO2_01_FULL_44_13]OGY73230.1 MAG: hypothetical protein A3H59_01975 [Candidatus Jacksonbacteria bacterium RIFCSPLOWO2_02_FULL_43_9]
MSALKKIIIIITGLILISIVVIFVITIRTAKTQPSSLTTDADAQDIQENFDDPISISKAVEYEPTPISEQERKERQMERFVSTFIERFGTFSNQNEFSNLEALKMVTTEQFYQWARRYGLGMMADNDSSVYYGITTQALNVSIDFSQQENPDAKRVYTVVTQRAEARGFEGNTMLFPQNADVELIKEGDQWLVNSVFWKKGVEG